VKRAGTGAGRQFAFDTVAGFPYGQSVHKPKGGLNMKRGLLVVAGVTAWLALFCGVSSALDRDARMIDTLAVEVGSYKQGETIGLSLWGETAAGGPEGRWAILFGGAAGEVWPDAGDDYAYWKVGLGMKYHLFQDTSLALIGAYMEFDYPDLPDIISGELLLKHRFVPADEWVSPYLLAGATIRNVEKVPEPATDEDFGEMVISVGLGCEFMINREFSFLFEGSWNETYELSDGHELPDWWLGVFGMRYYWK
jgi:hypothetical protein